jgi:hypothetical protein
VNGLERLAVSNVIETSIKETDELREVLQL